MELAIEHTGGSCYRQRGDDDGNNVSNIKPERYRESPMHSGSLSGTDVESAVQQLMGSLKCISSAVPRRFGMDDIVDIDEDDIAALEASLEWRDFLPHVRRSVLAEQRTSAVGRIHFVPRMIRSRPGTAYAVRYWKGLSNVQSLTAALGIVAAAWQMCQPPEPERVSNTHRKEGGTHKPVVGASSEAGHGPERFPAPLPGGISEQKKPSPAVTCEVTGQEQKASHHRGSTDGSSSREDVPIVLDASTVATKAHGGQTENSKDAGGAKEKAGIIDGDHKVQTSSSPSDCQSSTAVTLTKKKRRANPLLLGVIGFAAEWDSSSRQACVALIGDWPGIGSLQDLLEGKTAMRRTSQEDLITWTRQVAKGLVKICSSSGGGTSRTTASARGKLLLRISARNVYLFPKPKSEFSQEPKGVLDARVAMFLGPPLHNSPAEQDDAYPLLPPECILTRSGGGSPTGGDIPPTPLKAKTAQTGEEPADVWGMGTLVFELATAQIAGPTPLAARSLRDLLRAVPIGPRFLYGDLARAVMQLSFRKEPRERATAVQIAAIVEETATRTLRRAHIASDRQTCLLRAERRALESAEVSAGQDHDENAGDDADGYGQAVQIWSIKQAVERAKGRARAFLRQLWFDSLTEDDKRRVRHKRRYRKINENAKKARRRRVRAAVMHHWTPVEVATWAGGILHQAEIRGCLPLVSSGDAKGGIAVMRGNGDRNRQGSDATPDIGKPTTREHSSDGSVGEKQDQQQQQQQQQPEEQHKQHQQQQEQHQQQQQQQRQKQQHQQQHQHSGPAAGIGNENDSSGGADSSDNAHNGRDDRPDIVTDGMTSAQVGDGHGDNMASNQGAAWDKKDKNDGDSISSGGGSSAVDGDDDWASVDAAARKGYAGVIVEPAAMAKGVYGSCLVEAMEAAHTRAEDALTRFVKGSVRLPKPGEVETRRVALMVRELLTTRPNSAPGQIQMRAWLEVVVRSAEAPRDLVDGQIEAQLPALTRVLTAGYRRQVALAEEGRHLAAARLQGLARGAHARSLVSSIWRQADEFAADIIQGERETRRRAEIAQRAREKEEAAAREKEEAERYRLRLVPRASSVKCRSMEVSLPSFLVEATRGSRRFFVMEVTVSHPPALPTSPSTIGNYAWSFDEDDVGAIGRIHVLLREDSTVELEDSTHTAEGRNMETNVDQFVEVCSAGDTLPILALIPATTYRLTLELPHSARDYLLQSARALGVSAAVRALESAADSIAIGTDHEDVNHAASPVASPTHRRECGSVNGAYVDVVIPPDVPGVPRLICKVLTSASAVDLNDPDGVLSLRQWQSPYPGIAEMDGPCSPENMVLAPGRPEAIVSLRWTAPESNGLSICSYHVERRIGSTGGTWTRISTRRSDGGSGDGSGGGRGAKAAMSSLDAVDTPLKTIALDTLKDVALRCLMLEYRVIAENTLGVGAPSPPVEVNINAFLGHLQAHARAARHQDMPALLSSSLTRAAPEPRHGFKSGGLLHTGTAAAAAAADSYAEPAKNCDLALPRTEQHQQVQEIGDDQRHVASPPNGITMNATNAADATTARAPAQAGTREEAFFGDDFLGLRNFGEDRVHSLFAVGTTTTAEQASSSPRRSDATNKIRGGAVAPAGTTAAAPSFTTQSTLSPRFLPPIVGSTVSGAWGPGKKGHCYSRKGGNGDEKTFAAQLPGDDGGDEIGDDESGERLASGCADGGAPNNEVFHAFLNLGRRLPGRRRRNLGSSAQ